MNLYVTSTAPHSLRLGEAAVLFYAIVHRFSSIVHDPERPGLAIDVQHNLSGAAEAVQDPDHFYHEIEKAPYRLLC